jgi:hypothetical protein
MRTYRVGVGPAVAPSRKEPVPYLRVAVRGTWRTRPTAKQAKKKTARKSKSGVTGEIAKYARSSARAVTKAAKKMVGTKKKKKKASR